MSHYHLLCQHLKNSHFIVETHDILSYNYDMLSWIYLYIEGLQE